MSLLRQHAEIIYKEAISRALPDNAVEKVLRNLDGCSGKTYILAVGKAAWQMAAAASRVMDGKYESGLVITKYDHSQGPLPGFKIMEAGHPIVDRASFDAAEQALLLADGLKAEDRLIFLLSGGGSALFEKSTLSLEELQDISSQLLACGANINEINCIRKRLSDVKGGRFAQRCAPARLISVILSDVVGDRLDMIASGPTVIDSGLPSEADKIINKYGLRLSEKAMELIRRPMIDKLDNTESYICGSVSQLCASAVESCRGLGYEPVLITDHELGEARKVGRSMAEELLKYVTADKPIALILGGETIVKLTGHGKGGRNQELALAAAPILSGIPGTAVFSVGSDGTDGPTDAAGAFVDSSTEKTLLAKGQSVSDILQENDSYNALKPIDGLIFTGPTGTNVNDLSVALFNPKSK